MEIILLCYWLGGTQIYNKLGGFYLGLKFVYLINYQGYIEYCYDVKNKGETSWFNFDL